MRYSQAKKNEVLEALGSGMTRAEVSKLTGVPQGTVAHWQNPKGKTKPTIPALDTAKQDSLEQFVHSLEALITDYKKLKSERAMFHSQMEKWKVLAGKLNEDISSVV